MVAFDGIIESADATSKAIVSDVGLALALQKIDFSQWILEALSFTESMSWDIIGLVVAAPIVIGWLRVGHQIQRGHSVIACVE